MMKTLLIHTPENYTSVSSLTEPKAVQESMEKHETSYFETSVLTHARKRFMWLLFLMLSATVTGTIITRYENAFSAVPLLVSFIPMLMDTGGNCGSQSSTTRRAEKCRSVCGCNYSSHRTGRTACSFRVQCIWPCHTSAEKTDGSGT